MNYKTKNKMQNQNDTPPGKTKKNNPKNSTQTYLRIAEIRDNTVVLKNGGLRSVIKTTSINFNLKSEEEQNGIIYSYQNFLNSLEFPIQIVVRSKKLNVDKYIEEIKGLGDKQENKLLQEQTYEYAQYIQRLVDYADIMEKEFYVIVSYNPARSVSVGFLEGFLQRFSPQDNILEVRKRHSEFDKLKKELDQRTSTIIAGLENCGLKAKTLNTEELIELYYNIYNPISSRSAKLKNINELSIINDTELLDEKSYGY